MTFGQVPFSRDASTMWLTLEDRRTLAKVSLVHPSIAPLTAYGAQKKTLLDMMI